MEQYLSLVKEVLENGEEKRDRTGTGTLSLFGTQRRFDLRNGFPLLTTKKVNFNAMLRELLWFLRGATNINDNLKTNIWNPWADATGELGPIYGYQWRKWEVFEEAKTETPEKTSPTRKHRGLQQYRKMHVDQIKNALELIKQEPWSRRIIISAWNVADLPRMALMPCHTLFQFNVADQWLDLQLYQRSADIALGVPFNIASYSTLLMMAAQECGKKPRYFIHTLGDAHIYLNHVEGLREQLTRKPHPLPTLKIKKKPFDELAFEDFEIQNYVYDEPIKFEISV